MTTGISKADLRGLVADIHALRHAFGTHLTGVGGHPRIAMAAMRHGRIKLTMNVYTDPLGLQVPSPMALTQVRQLSS